MSSLPFSSDVSAKEAAASAVFIQETASAIRAEMEKVIMGQTEVINLLLTGLLAEGHVLLEGLPGTAKTTLVKTLAKTLDIGFSRIQLTPDLLPAEITGTSIYDLNSRTFSFQRGPVFTDLLLADEINRTPPKTQSALLEAMAEKQVTADGETIGLSSLFTVIATLNPIELHGTFPLPEAQLDRFMMKVHVCYPAVAAEHDMLRQFAQNPTENRLPVQAVSSKEVIVSCRAKIQNIHVENCIIDYVLSLIQDTRSNPNVQLGCSPRAAIALLSASRAAAAVSGKPFVSPDHVKQVATAVMSHRIMLTPDAEMEGLTANQLVQQTLQKIPVPR